MNPPESVLEGVSRALDAQTGRPSAIRGTSPVGGGCINPSARVDTEDGESWFLKWNDSAPDGMFQAEADGLAALGAGAQGTGISVPEVVGWGGAGTRTDPGWLLMEFIPRGSPGPDYGRRLGEGLALLQGSPATRPPPPATDDPSAEGHSSPSEAPPPLTFGWHRDNFIGSLPQGNATSESWPAFWRDRRIEPQLRLAKKSGYFRGQAALVFHDLLERMDHLLDDAAGAPALLHGDLWSGNFYPGPRGDPVLLDPAVYRGHGEVDLAMMELFGSLPPGFREGYGGPQGLPAAYDAFRRDLYQLYYLLVHVNLFGGGYVGGSVAAARRALAGA